MNYDAKLEEVLADIENLPESQRAALQHIVEETKKRHADIKTATSQSLTALDDWRLMMKYMIFDQEARIREAQAGHNPGNEPGEE